MRESVVCPTFHVERLDDDRVWTALRRALECVAKHGGRATAFVSTRRARQERSDLAERLQWIADHGNEIAMHTHFRRAPGPGQSGESVKHASFTEDDIVASLEADYAYLVERGHRPQGFCAGGWAIHPTAAEWLRDHGFQYDCSFRSYKLNYENPSAAAGDSHHGVSMVNGTVMIPTTATVREMLLSRTPRRYPSLPYERGTYALFYVHDWGLVAQRNEIAFRLLARRLRSSSVLPVGELAQAIGSTASDAD